MRHYLAICDQVERAEEAKQLNLLGWMCFQNWHQHKNEPPKDHYWIEKDCIFMNFGSLYPIVQLGDPISH